MVHLIKEFEAWYETYEGNILEYTHEGTGKPYFVNIDALRTDIDDGMYDVELSNGSHPYIASNQVCIVDGMVVLETLKIVINESMELDHHHNAYEGVRLNNGVLQLGLDS
jgi:hypothetical protein